ncbi:MAG: peptide chain release factor 1 [Proteobacteria bacterium]|nr:peptide chain release factor 1 [Desulfobulbaceae bacterium]MBU4151427.1 peptide chain release factor 1 [Pseudomonadota bacterium]
MFSKFEHLHEKRLELEAKLSDPSVHSKPAEYQRIAKEHSHVVKMDELYAEYQHTELQLQENQDLLANETDDEMLSLIKADVTELINKKVDLERELKVLLLPPDPNDQKNILLEIRAGTGGDEAALFVADLFRMYSRYAETQNWKIEVLSSNAIGIGGFKEIIAMIKGDKVFSRLKYESGVHRVQRVPETEAQGRIHTSAVTVAVMPEAEDVELQIQPNELRVDIFRSSGPGGQSVNTTDSAVRITHLPSGMIVTCQDEKSQHKNKESAMKVMRARLFDKLQQEQHDLISATRKSQIGTGDRSERIRTYNFPQGRVSDHRINLTLYKIEEIMLGKIDDLLDPLLSHYQAEVLKTIQ